MSKQDFTVTWFKVTTGTSTSTWHDLSQFIQEFSGLELVAELEEGHSLGDAWAESVYTGLRTVSPITIGGFYDDVASSGPVAIFGNASDLGAERAVKMCFGTTNIYPKVDVIVKRFTRTPTRGEITKYEVELQPTGAYTIGTT